MAGMGRGGKRTSTSDEALRPAIPISQSDERNCELTQFIRAVGRIHDENEEFHGGRYQELLLTNASMPLPAWCGLGHHHRGEQ